MAHQWLYGELARVLSSILVFLLFLSGIIRLSGVSHASLIVRSQIDHFEARVNEIEDKGSRLTKSNCFNIN